MAIKEWKTCTVYADGTSMYDTIVWERDVVNGERGAWKPRAHYVTGALEGHVSARSRLKSILVRLAADLPST